MSGSRESTSTSRLRAPSQRLKLVLQSPSDANLRRRKHTLKKKSTKSRDGERRSGLRNRPKSSKDEDKHAEHEKEQDEDEDEDEDGDKKDGEEEEEENEDEHEDEHEEIEEEEEEEDEGADENEHRSSYTANLSRGASLLTKLILARSLGTLHMDDDVEEDDPDYVELEGKPKDINYMEDETQYLQTLSSEQLSSIFKQEQQILDFNKSVIPQRFKVLNYDVDTSTKSFIMKKLIIFTIYHQQTMSTINYISG